MLVYSDKIGMRYHSLNYNAKQNLRLQVNSILSNSTAVYTILLFVVSLFPFQGQFYVCVFERYKYENTIRRRILCEIYHVWNYDSKIQLYLCTKRCFGFEKNIACLYPLRRNKIVASSVGCSFDVKRIWVSVWT